MLNLHMEVDGQRIPSEGCTVQQGSEAVVDLHVRINEGRKGVVSVYVDDATLSQVLIVPVADARGEHLVLEPGEHRLRVPLGNLEMNAGRYSLLVGIRDPQDDSGLCRHQGLHPFTVLADRVYWSKFVRKGTTEHSAVLSDVG